MLKMKSPFKNKKQRKINEVCAKMRAAKERKRLTGTPPAYPPDAKIKRSITLEIFDHKEPVKIIYQMIGGDSKNRLWLFKNGQRLNQQIGWRQALTRIAKENPTKTLVE